MIVTAGLIRWYAACERHVWLHTHGGDLPRDLPTAAALYRLAEGVRHEDAVLRATTPGLVPVPVRDWTDGVEQTRRLMRQGASVIAGAHLEAGVTLDGFDTPVIVRGVVDRLVRVKADGSPRYAPIEIKLYRAPQAADRLQLDTCLWLLAQSQGGEPPTGELWLGQNVDGTPAQRLPCRLDEAGFLDTLRAVARLLADVRPEPDIVIAPHCQRCPWYTACRLDAEQRHSVGVLSLRRETREHFAREDIVTLDQIRAMDAETLLTFRHVGPKTVHALKAQAEAYLQNRPLWYGTLSDVCREPGWFFDIETDPFNGRVWSIGWCWHTDDVQIVIVAPRTAPQDVELPDGRRITLVPDADAAWRTLAASVVGNEQPIYNWTGFDAGNMRQHAPDVYARLGGRLHDLHASFKKAIQLPARSMSLKVVAPFAGFHWQGYEDWMQAFTDYQRYLKVRSGEALAAACAYQADDVVAMVYVWEWLNAAAPPGV